MAHAELSVLPLGTSSPSLSGWIAEIQRVLAAQDAVRYELHAMGTTLEGETAALLELVGRLHAVPFDHGAERVYSVIKLDERRDKPGQTAGDKVAAVRVRLAD